jgi:hypothetical protein
MDNHSIAILHNRPHFPGTSTFAFNFKNLGLHWCRYSKRFATPIIQRSLYIHPVPSRVICRRISSCVSRWLHSERLMVRSGSVCRNGWQNNHNIALAYHFARNRTSGKCHCSIGPDSRERRGTLIGIPRFTFMLLA